MRTFIAIEIPDEIKQQLTEVQQRLKGTGIEAGWPRPEGIHLTLKFLGEVPESLVPEINNALIRSTEGIGRFRLEIRGAGAFPNARNARVAWIGVSGDTDTLNRLQAAIENVLEPLGLAREVKPFKPHLTLARVKHIPSRQKWLSELEGLKEIRLAGFEVQSISLMKSELKRTGAEYTQVARVELR